MFYSPLLTIFNVLQSKSVSVAFRLWLSDYVFFDTVRSLIIKEKCSRKIFLAYDITIFILYIIYVTSVLKGALRRKGGINGNKPTMIIIYLSYINCEYFQLCNETLLGVRVSLFMENCICRMEVYPEINCLNFTMCTHKTQVNYKLSITITVASESRFTPAHIDISFPIQYNFTFIDLSVLSFFYLLY